MKDLQRVAREVRKSVISGLYQIDNRELIQSMPTAAAIHREMDKAPERYETDHIFRANVELITARVMESIAELLND